MSALDRIPFFEGVETAQIVAYSQQCAWRRYCESELVVDFDDSSTDVYFIVSGEVRVLLRTAAGKEVILSDIGAGGFFGEMAAIEGSKRSANVTASTRTELCIMPASVFKNLVFSEPAVCERLLVLLSGRIRELNTRLCERSALDLRHRLYAELLRLSAPRRSAPGQAMISPPPLQQDLAARIGCRREQVSRELKAMQGEGLASRTRGALVLMAPEIMHKRVQDAMAHSA